MSEVRLGTALREAQRQIEPLDARVLLCHVTGRSAAYLIAHSEMALGAAQHAKYAGLVRRRAAGEPVAYLTGEREFYGRTFNVTPSVLIPRPETELLVELALEHVPRDAPARVLELGTGSGCVALTIVSERSHVEIVASDQSLAALQVAASNARTLGAERVRFIHSDWFASLDGERFAMVISNPPYVADLDPHLLEGALRFEPQSALVAGVDGLDCIRAIVAGAGDHLVPGGWLMLEHGHDQAAAVGLLMEAHGYDEVFSAPDLAGIARVSGGRLTMPAGDR